jgi:hypothetical protein
MNSLRLFSYVVEHDTGFAPNPDHGYCTLAHCKYKKRGKRRNLIEMAQHDNWVAGTGGADPKKSAGHGKLIYLMRITERMSLEKYWNDPRFREKRPSLNQKFPGDNKRDRIQKGRFVLISDHFWYFGKKAKELPPALAKKIEKKGPGYRCQSIKPNTVQELIDWVKRRFPKMGAHGKPCKMPKNVRERRKCPCH